MDSVCTFFVYAARLHSLLYPERLMILLENAILSSEEKKPKFNYFLINKNGGDITKFALQMNFRNF